jgi:Domain of unknown function (DUF397)
MTDLSQAAWFKATASQNNGGCVEVAINLPGVVAIRDSKNPAGGAHVISTDAFAAFVGAARAGRFDLASEGQPPAC